jgi:hypothetical protein
MGNPNTFKMTVNLSSFGQAMGKLAKGMDDAVRPAAQAGAQVLYDEVVKNVAAIGVKTGNLKRAIYQVYSGQNNNKKKALYYISWNTQKAPHGWLVEYGHIQRYQAYQRKDGTWRTKVRPEMRGKPKPETKNRAVLDAYYVLRKGGPIQVPARSFIRNAVDKVPAAREAMRLRFAEELRSKGVLK